MDLPVIVTLILFVLVVVAVTLGRLVVERRRQGGKSALHTTNSAETENAAHTLRDEMIKRITDKLPDAQVEAVETTAFRLSTPTLEDPIWVVLTRLHQNLSDPYAADEETLKAHFVADLVRTVQARSGRSL